MSYDISKLNRNYPIYSYVENIPSIKKKGWGLCKIKTKIG